MRQHTLSRTYAFEGKGLHTGVHTRMNVRPAEPGTGVVFVRTDLGGASVAAVAENVSSTARSTTLEQGQVQVHTVEHILSALTGMGIDNAVVELDNIEVPILDGSARPYVEAFSSDPLPEQDAPRICLSVDSPVEVRDEKSGSWVRIEPADESSYELTVDFNSRVRGVQTLRWDASVPYASEIGICRTFVFFHEIEYLFANNLIKGGDVDNAIVVVEHPVTPEQVAAVAAKIGKAALAVEGNGYLSNVSLSFPDECGRHKMLDMIGDLRLCGGFLKAKVTAFKPGHGINTLTAKAFRKAMNK